MSKFTNRLAHAWNAFMNKDPTETSTRYVDLGISNGIRPDRARLTRGNEKSIVTSVYNRIAIDVAAIDIEHVRLDDQGRFSEVIHSELNNCLQIEANRDQTARALRRDIVMSMFDEGCIAVVPTDTTGDPWFTKSYDVLSLRTGKILQWYPQHVQVRLYNENTALYEDKVFEKRFVAIIENPMYAICNEHNSTLQRLIHKLNLLDAVDEQSSAGKLDLIIQLPYLVKTEARRQQAEQRRKDIEEQLAGSKYGIAYTDGSEHVTQLNRSVENHLMEQIEYLTSMVYSQLGITKEILDGTADEKTMLNYTNRTVEPIISAIVDEFNRKFITKTARTQGQKILFFKDPFRLIPISNLAEIVDKFTRNEVLSSNEARQIVGLKPVKDAKADELRNSNNASTMDGQFPSTNDAVAEESEEFYPEDDELMDRGLLGQF